MHVRVAERFCVEGSFTSEKLNDFRDLRVMVKVCFIFSMDCHLQKLPFARGCILT